MVYGQVCYDAYSVSMAENEDFVIHCLRRPGRRKNLATRLATPVQEQEKAPQLKSLQSLLFKPVGTAGFEPATP